MRLTTVLFDLDGTLLPMDNESFTRGYFKLLAAKLISYGYRLDRDRRNDKERREKKNKRPSDMKGSGEIQ